MLEYAAAKRGNVWPPLDKQPLEAVAMPKSILSRIMSRVDVRGPDECWPWTGGIRSNGYPMFGVKRNGKWTQTTAARALYEEHFGELPDDWEPDHTCRNRACLNLNHLEGVSLQVNRQRRNDAKTHCSRGHAYTDETTRWQFSKGYWGRVCRICENARHRERYHGLSNR